MCLMLIYIVPFRAEHVYCNIPWFTILSHWPLGDVHEIFKLIPVIGGWGISCEIALRWMPLALTADKSTLVQVMAWCRQATSNYLRQCWPRDQDLFRHMVSLGHNELRLKKSRLIKIHMLKEKGISYILHILWYLLIHRATETTTSLWFDLSAAHYHNNQTISSVDGQQEWYGRQAHISAEINVG